MEDEENLIELPDENGDEEAPDFAEIAAQLRAGPDDGELAINDGGGYPEETAKSKPRSPIRMHFAYFTANAPLDLWVQFLAWNDGPLRTDDEQFQALPEHDRFILWQQEMAARDAIADERRPPDQKEYNFSAFFGSQSYRKVVMGGQPNEAEKAVRSDRALFRRQIAGRLRAELPEWSDEEIRTILIGPDGSEE